MKNRSAILTLFTANAISGFAQGISMLAIPWKFALLGESLKFNAMFFFVTLGAMFWGLYAGTLIDRYNRKKVFIVTNLIEGIILCCVAYYGSVIGDIPIWGIGIVFATTAFGFTIHFPTIYAFIQEISDPKDYTKITSMLEVIGQLTSMVAGACAALLLDGLVESEQFEFFGRKLVSNFSIDKWKIDKIFMFDGLTYLASAFLLLFIRYTPYKIIKVEKSSLVERLKTGFIYLKEHSHILLFGFFSYAVFVVLLVEMFSVMPMYIKNHLGGTGIVFGTAEILYAMGAVIAGITVNRFFKKVEIVKKIIFLTVIISLSFFILGFTKDVSLFLVLSIFIGIANAGTRIYRMEYLFKNIGNEVIGRVNGIFNMTNIVARLCFIGLFTNSYFKEGSNIAMAYNILGCFAILAAFVLYSNRKRF